MQSKIIHEKEAGICGSLRKEVKNSIQFWKKVCFSIEIPEYKEASNEIDE
jgi:hypothetical protein